MEGVSSPGSEINLSHGRNGNTDSSRGGVSGRPGGKPLLGYAAKSLIKKKKEFLLSDCVAGSGENNNGSPEDGGIGLSREFTVVMHKNGLCSDELGQQKAKTVWKKHVWLLLPMDLIICAIMFVVWLCNCWDFKCVDG